MLGFAYPQLGERLDRLEEAAAICRGLLDGERVTFDGTWFEMHDAVNDPAPIQARLPLVIGGSGKKRTLRIVARYADWWNADGDDPQAFAALSAILDEHCAAVGRDPTSIRRTLGQPPPLIRDSVREARHDLAEILVAQGMPPHRRARRGGGRSVCRTAIGARRSAGRLRGGRRVHGGLRLAGAVRPRDPGGPRRHHLIVRASIGRSAR